MNQKQLNEIKERVEKATPGPWEVVGCNHVWTTLGGSNIFGEKAADNDGWLIAIVNHNHFTSLEDGRNEAMTVEEKLAVSEFIAHAREDVPALIAEVERLKNELEAVCFVNNTLKSERESLEFHLKVSIMHAEELEESLESEVETNERLREALEDIASTGYTHLEILNIAQKALDDYEEEAT